MFFCLLNPHRSFLLAERRLRIGAIHVFTWRARNELAPRRIPNRKFIHLFLESSESSLSKQTRAQWRADIECHFCPLASLQLPKLASSLPLEPSARDSAKFPFSSERTFVFAWRPSIDRLAPDSGGQKIRASQLSWAGSSLQPASPAGRQRTMIDCARISITSQLFQAGLCERVA